MNKVLSVDEEVPQIDLNKYDFKNSERLMKKIPRGLSLETVKLISKLKDEPAWMLEHRLKSYVEFLRRPMPTWGADLSGIDFQEMYYYITPEMAAENATNWSDVPDEIKETFEKLGIPEAERKYLAGSVAQYESTSIYANVKKLYDDLGVLFMDMDSALKKHPDLVKKYFMKGVPYTDNKFAALHGAVWSGGSFLYVPKGVKVDLPFQTYFRMNAANEGQFEHTLIVAEEESEGVYLEGCTAPKYTTNSLHSAIVEIFVHKNAKMRYTTVQNWSKNVYNLNTKRAIVEENGKMEWVGGSLGCLTGDSIIYSNPGGPIRMNEVKVGQPLYSLDLNSMELVKTKVKAVVNSGVKEVFLLTTNDGREIKASANHPFLAYSPVPRTLSWKPLEEIKQNDFVCIARSLPDYGSPLKLSPQVKGRNLVNLPNETTEELMWLLGVYVGDGYMEKGTRVYFAVPKEDKSRSKLEQVLEHFAAKTKVKGICLTVNSIMLCSLLEELGFSGLASTKRIPKWVYGLPRKQKLAFIEGYLDSDGYVRKKFGIRKRTPSGGTFTSCNKELLEDFKMLMSICGLMPGRILSHTRKRPSPTAKGNRQYTNYAVNVPGADVLSIRTHEIDGPEGILFSRVISKASLGQQETFDLEIDGPPNFIANGIIVHNSKITMLYPMTILKGDNSSASHLNIAFGTANTCKDGGAKVIHMGKNTTSKVIAKSISSGGGVSVYRGLLRINAGALNAKSHVQCDALILDKDSRSDTYPHNEIYEPTANFTHEASVGKISDEQLFYLQSRGLNEAEARSMIVLGFLDDVMREIPLEFSVEMNRLIHLEMEKLGAVG